MSNYKHGHGKHDEQSPTYVSWYAMKRRCDNPNHDAYKFYGAVGITYDPRWNIFENFLADMGERPYGRTLDRIDGTLNYYKENCRWATKREQVVHTKGVILTPADVEKIKYSLENKDQSVSVRRWARNLAPYFGVSDNTIRAIANGRLWK
jgi:hypothetical protein